MDSYDICKSSKDKLKLLTTELSAKETGDMFNLFTHYNIKTNKYNILDPSSYYLYEAESIKRLFKKLFEFEQEEDNIDNTELFEKALSVLEKKVLEFPALAFLLENASRDLSLEDMERYFPSTNKTEMFNDIQIYSELRSDKKTYLYEYMFLQNVQKQSFDDYFNGSESYINQRIELLQNMFLGGLWIILINPPLF